MKYFSGGQRGWGELIDHQEQPLQVWRINKTLQVEELEGIGKSDELREGCEEWTPVIIKTSQFTWEKYWDIAEACRNS